MGKCAQPYSSTHTHHTHFGTCNRYRQKLLSLLDNVAAYYAQVCGSGVWPGEFVFNMSAVVLHFRLACNGVVSCADAHAYECMHLRPLNSYL